MHCISLMGLWFHTNRKNSRKSPQNLYNILCIQQLRWIEWYGRLHPNHYKRGETSVNLKHFVPIQITANIQENQITGLVDIIDSVCVQLRKGNNSTLLVTFLYLFTTEWNRSIDSILYSILPTCIHITSTVPIELDSHCLLYSIWSDSNSRFVGTFHNFIFVYFFALLSHIRLSLLLFRWLPFKTEVR